MVRVHIIYYPPEVSSMTYCCLRVFRKEYLGSKNKQYLRGNTQATIFTPLAIILTVAVRALVSLIA